MACLVKGEKVWGQNPQVVRIQIDGCGLTPPIEVQTESFQFINGSQPFNLSSNLSISGFGSMSSWKPVPTIVQSLNNLLTGCTGLFVDPYAPPYNGVIPPGGVVWAYIDQNPITTAKRFPASYCNNSIIFVISGAGHNNLPMFANKSECNAPCNRSIQITIGNITFGFNYDPYRLFGNNGDFILIDNNGQITYSPDTDACWPEAIPCDKPKFIIGNQSPNACASSGYELPEMSDFFTGNAMYFSGPGRTGTAYAIGKTINQSMTLYANDFNSCNPTATANEKQFTINITPGSDIDDGLSRKEQTCGYYLLPTLSGTGLTGTQKYWSGRNGTGTSYLPSDTIKANITLYAYDKQGTCDDEEQLIIQFNAGPTINNPKDTTIACGNTFSLPPITGTNTTGLKSYYTLPSKSGQQLLIGSMITAGGLYYAYDEFGHCFDEDTFRVTFATGALYAGNADLGSCDSIQLPVIGGSGFNRDSTFYFTGTRGSGIRYRPGNKIGQTTTLYIYDVSSACTAQDTIQVSLNPPPRLDRLVGFGGCSEFVLPKDTLSPNARYYFLSGGQGNFLLAGEKVSSDTVLYKFIGDSVCFDQKKITIDIELPPELNDLRDTTVCGDFVLRPIQGKNLTGRQSYYLFQGGQGAPYSDQGTGILTSSKLVYAFDVNSYNCKDEKQFTVTILPKPLIDPITDISVCNSYILPAPTGQNIPTVAFYDQPNGQGNKYTIGQVITQSLRLYAYQASPICAAEQGFQILITPGPVFSNVDISDCQSLTLPVIVGSGFQKESTFYFTGSRGTGTQYTPSNTLTQSATLYIYDRTNSCAEDTIRVNIGNSKNITISTRLNGCDSVFLPSDPANPDLVYYANFDHLGAKLLPGQWVKSTSSLYAYAGDMNTCFDQKQIFISIQTTPQLIPMSDTTVCGQFKLPAIQGKNLTGTEHFNILSGNKGTPYYGDGRSFIDSSLLLYVWDGNINGCWDEDTFNIKILPVPFIDSVPEVNACESYNLPMPAGRDLSSPAYFGAPGGTGTQYDVGVTLTQSKKLFIYQSSAACPAERPLTINIQDSITSSFMLSASITCPEVPIDLIHTGKKNAATGYSWSLAGPGSATLPTFTNLPTQQIKLDTGDYQITLSATAVGCVGQTQTQSIQVVPKLTPLRNLTCDAGPDKIVFKWDATPQAMDYGIELLAGPTGVRSPYAMIFNNLTLGQQVGVRVTPLGAVPCANGTAASLVCRTNACEQISVTIVDEAPFCSGDGPKLLVVRINPLPGDTIGLQRKWSGPGMVDGLFYPSLAGPGNHTIRYTLTTRDSCVYFDSTIIQVGQGSVIILNDKAVECAPPSQRQFNIRMQITTNNTPYTVHYSYAGGRSSTFQSGAANFTLSASFGLIGDSITIDSIVDATGCKMQITSMAGTLTFRAVQYINTIDTVSICDFGTQTYQYRVRIHNPNHNDPLVILSGGGTLQDSIYISPAIPFGTRHQASVSHRNGCDTLHWDMIDQCACTSIRDTVRLNACENDVIQIHGKRYTVNNPSGSDTIPPAAIGTCDTIRWVVVTFTRDVLSLIRSSICEDDFITVGNTIFDKNNLTGVIRLPNASANGCDSVISVDLELLGPVIRMVRDTLCAGESVVIDGLRFDAGHLRDTVSYTHMASNGCDSIVYYDIRYDDIQAGLTLESAGCTAGSGKSVLIRTITGGTGAYTYALSPAVAYTPIAALPLRINNPPSDTFNLLIKSAAGCVAAFPIAFSPLNTGGRLDLGPDRVIKLGDIAQIPINANFTITKLTWITQNYLSCTDCLTPVTQPLVTTLYVLDASDVNGCTARDTLRIYVDPEVEFYVPNIFSLNSALEPNLNLNIFPSPQVFNVLRFSIYDRWGNAMIDLKNLPLSNGIPVWDGKFKGSDAPGAVYVYKVLYETVDGRVKTKYGDITLVR